MGGSFHIAPGESFSLNNFHIHDVNPFESTAFNLTHFIKHLSFGEKITHIRTSTHPLDDNEVYATDGKCFL